MNYLCKSYRNTYKKEIFGIQYCFVHELIFVFASILGFIGFKFYTRLPYRAKLYSRSASRKIKLGISDSYRRKQICQKWGILDTYENKTLSQRNCY